MKIRRRSFRAMRQQIVRAYNAENAGATRPEPVTAAIRLWYNPSRSSQRFYGPGIYVMAMSLFPPLLATLAMSKEGEQKTILQVYVSNISAHEFLLGKIAAFMIVASDGSNHDDEDFIHGLRAALRRRSDAISCGYRFCTCSP